MTRSFFGIKKLFFLYISSFFVIFTAYIPLSHSAENTINEEQPAITLTPSNITPSKTYLVFLNILDRKDIWGELPWELSEQNIRNVALYHSGDKLQHQLDKTTLSLIENKLSLSLIDNDVNVKTCIQCAKTYVNVKKAACELSIAPKQTKNYKRWLKIFALTLS